MSGELRRRHRQVNRGDSERVGHGISETDWCAHAVAFADALGPKWRERRKRLDVQDGGGGYLSGRWQEIVDKGAGEKGTLRRVGKLLIKCGADPLREAACDLARNHAGMQNAPAVMHGDIFVDAHRASDAINFDSTEIENESVAKRRIDFVGIGRRGEFRGRPEHGLAQRLIALGHHARRPVAGGGEARKRNAVVRIAARTHAPAGEFDFDR